MSARPGLSVVGKIRSERGPWLAAVIIIATAPVVGSALLISYVTARAGYQAPGACSFAAAASYVLLGVFTDLRAPAWQVTLGFRLGVLVSALLLGFFMLWSEPARAAGASYWTATGLLAGLLVTLSVAAGPLSRLVADYGARKLDP